jgi:hypothetical protein
MLAVYTPQPPTYHPSMNVSSPWHIGMVAYTESVNINPFGLCNPDTMDPSRLLGGGGCVAL